MLYNTEQAQISSTVISSATLMQSLCQFLAHDILSQIKTTQTGLRHATRQELNFHSIATIQLESNNLFCLSD